MKEQMFMNFLMQASPGWWKLDYSKDKQGTLEQF